MGSQRNIVFRLKSDRGHERAYGLPAGPLLFMPNEVQSEWLHAIPKIEGVGPRISLTFRRLATGEGIPAS
jgi:hypothetical protein